MPAVNYLGNKCLHERILVFFINKFRVS